MPVPFKQGNTAQTYDATTGAVTGTLGLQGQLNFFNSVLGEGGVPVGVANSGTTTNVGALTLGTALPRIYPAIWLWFPAGVVVGDATGGFYYTVMSSTTVGQIYLNPGKFGGATGNSAVTTPFQPFVPATLVTPTAGQFAAAGYTGSTAEIFLVNVTVPPGGFGLQGRSRITSHQTCNNSAGAKTFKTYLGASQLGQSGAYTTSTGGTQMIAVRNCGAENFNMSQIVGGTSASAAVYTAVQTSAIGTPFIAISAQAAVATDVVVLEGYIFEIAPKD